ncbi:MAG: hypothetical protein LC623_00610 [Halobacteriales archaeon]|nr:hypothetical protein [Halobacteriales archaeon]
MDLPPPSYFLLLLLTAAAAPLLVALAPRRRGVLGLSLGGLALAWLGLALLHYDRLLCWPLVAAGAAVLGVAGVRRAWGVALALPAVAAGVLFQMQPGIPGFASYFGVGLPMALLVALGAVALRLSRDAPPGRALAGSTLILAGATLVPLSSFGFGFLEGFEVAHAAWFAATAAGLGLLASASFRPPVLDSPAAYAGRGGGRPWLAAGGLLAAAAFLAIVPLLPTRPEGVGPVAGTLLALAGATAALLGALGVHGLAGWWAERERAAFSSSFAGGFDGEVAWPGPSLVRDAAQATVAELRRVAAELDRSRAPLGVLRVHGGGNLDTLPEDALAWLEGQDGPRLVHVAWREGPETFLVPPITPEETP